ncbi:MAG: recombinase family protein [Parvularculaceae bacterium]
MKSLACAIYTRKSSEEGLEQEFNSLDAQREACEAYIKSQASEGWRLAPERFDDGGFSGGNMERPGLQKLINAIKRRRIQVVVVYKIDRLTRSLADFARLVEVLDAYGASFVSVTQQFNTTTSMGRLTLNVLLSFAQFEREVTSERIRDKIGASKRKGMWMGGFPPLGYDIVNRRLAVNEKEAAQAREIFDLALKEPSLSKLVTAIADRGIRSKSWKTQKGETFGGSPLSRTSVHKLLRSPIYIGKIRQGGKLYDGEQEGTIDEGVWSAVQARLDERRQGERELRKNAKSKAPLLGLLFDDAGNRMAATSSGKPNLRHHYYVSTPKLRGQEKPVGSISRVNAERTERVVFAALEGAKVAPPGAEKSDLLNSVERIILHANEIEIQLHDRTGEPQTIRVAVELSSAVSAERFVDGDRARARPDPALIRAIVLAHDWAQTLERGAMASANAIAESAGVSERYVWKMLRLAFLAPDIVEAILSGNQPRELTLRRINDTQLSTDWSRQRAVLGFDAA